MRIRKRFDFIAPQKFFLKVLKTAKKLLLTEYYSNHNDADDTHHDHHLLGENKTITRGTEKLDAEFNKTHTKTLKLWNLKCF